ncbi:MAG: hypothetical protein ACT6S0_04940 [Roseateles sp.]|uniref:hypothetical protein n=1 Tax=Roseateles sp. TaxID=1971397 RepID=UPI0040352266
MSGTLSEMGFGGGSRVTSLPCGFSAASGILSLGPAITTLSGATLAGTSNLKTLLNVTGSRVRLNALKFQAADATARNVRVVITIDGVVVFDNTAACADTNHRAAVGVVKSDTNSSLLFQPVDALNSVKIEFGCSLAETDKLSFSYNYEVR